MLPSTESACFVIADISGYTNFVSGVELDHAQDIIADIMDTLVRALRPPFRLAIRRRRGLRLRARRQGRWVARAGFDRAGVFRLPQAAAQHQAGHSCECQACSRMQSLDVKFVVHHGAFIRQRMSGREELAGRDVILGPSPPQERRQQSTWRARLCAYSDACARAMGIDPKAQGLVEHSEAIEHIGETKCWVRDLDEAWNREAGRPGMWFSAPTPSR